MTNKEYKDMIAQLQSELGLSKKDIAISFFSLFYDDEINRKQLDALLAGIGFAVSDDYANMSDEELKSKIFKKEDEPKKGVTEGEIEEAKTDETGDVPPQASKSRKNFEKKESAEDDGEKKEEKEDEEKEKEEVMKMYFPNEK